MPSKELLKKYWSIPYSQWKCFAVPIYDPNWGKKWYYVEAPNKTLAREFTLGEVNPWVKVKGDIREIDEKEFPRHRVFGPNFRGDNTTSPATERRKHHG
jgi:hypothetical protein